MKSARVPFPHPPAAEQKMDQGRESKVERGSENLGLNLTWFVTNSVRVPSLPKRKTVDDRMCRAIKDHEGECGGRELDLDPIMSKRV